MVKPSIWNDFTWDDIQRTWGDFTWGEIQLMQGEIQPMCGDYMSWRAENRMCSHSGYPLSSTPWDWHGLSLGPCSIFSNLKFGPAWITWKVVNQWAIPTPQCCQFLPFLPKHYASDVVIEWLSRSDVKTKVM